MTGIGYMIGVICRWELLGLRLSQLLLDLIKVLQPRTAVEVLRID